MTCSTSEVAVCCSSASERCPRASASSRVRASSCFFNSISKLGPLLTRALVFVPVERSLRPRVGLFAPLRDKGHLVGTVTGFPSGRPSQGSVLPILTHNELASSCVDGPCLARENVACRTEVACSHVSGLFTQSGGTAGPDGVREPRPHHSSGIDVPMNRQASLRASSPSGLREQA